MLCHRTYRIMMACVVMLGLAMPAGAEPVRISGPMQPLGDVGFSFQLTPNGLNVVFVADADTDGVNELYVVPAGGGSRTRLSGALVAGGNVGNFAISPDNTRVIFRSDKDNVTGVFELYGTVPATLALDIDGNGAVDALTDGLLLIRWQLGLRGAALIAGAVGPDATRATAASIEAYLTTLGVLRAPF